MTHRPATGTHSRPETYDAHGAHHRHGCTTPGWVSNRPAVQGWHVLRCAACGAVRLTRGRPHHPCPTGAAQPAPRPTPRRNP